MTCSRLPRRVLAGSIVLLLLLLAGCGDAGPGQGGASEAAADASAGVKVYTVRGQVTQLPIPDRPGSELMVRHEPIPEFENAQGEVVGMNAMIMPFPLADGVALGQLEVGDKVELTFEMRFKPQTFYQVTAISPLPAETALDLGGGSGEAL